MLWEPRQHDQKFVPGTFHHKVSAIVTVQSHIIEMPLIEQSMVNAAMRGLTGHILNNTYLQRIQNKPQTRKTA